MPEMRCGRYILSLLIFASAVALSNQSSINAGDRQLASWAQVVEQVEPKMVKIYGAGGIAGLEGYQSGFFVSGDGHILTSWSSVLDVDDAIVITDGGERFVATLVGIDPKLEIAILKVDGAGFSHFKIAESVDVTPGQRVLAFSNLYGIATGEEAASVMRGSVMAKTPLVARRGSSRSTYTGPVYVVDAIANNPGSAGGALTDSAGELAGMLGKELRDERTNIWLNYAIPISQMKSSITRIITGEGQAEETDVAAVMPKNPHTLADLGIILIPPTVARSPSFVDGVVDGSLADQAGIMPDDLLLLINDKRVDSQAALRESLKYIDKADPIELVIQRAGSLVTCSIRP